jgi:hypothetical protein
MTRASWTLLGAVLVAPAAAQRPVTVSGGFAYLDYRIDAGFGIERFSGISGTAAAHFTVMRGVNGVAGLALGQLDAATSGALNRSLTQLALTAKVPMGQLVEWQAGVMLRSYGTRLAHQRWMVASLGAELHVPFPTRTIEGRVRGTYFPVVEERGLPRPTLAFGGAAGMWYRISGTRLGVTASLERYDFPAAQAPARREQLARLSFELSVDLRRTRPAAP